MRYIFIVFSNTKRQLYKTHKNQVDHIVSQYIGKWPIERWRWVWLEKTMQQESRHTKQDEHVLHVDCLYLSPLHLILCVLVWFFIACEPYHMSLFLRLFFFCQALDFVFILPTKKRLWFYPTLIFIRLDKLRTHHLQHYFYIII